MPAGDHHKPTRFPLRSSRFHTIIGVPAELRITPDCLLNREVLPQHLLQFTSRPTRNANHLVARSLTRQNLHRAAGHRENLSKKFPQRNIRASLHRRRRKCKFQRVANGPGDGCSRSSRMNPHRKSRSQRMVVDGNHFGYFRAPNNAVPMRTWVAPSAIATGKSCDIPMDSSANDNRGCSAASRLRNLRSSAK